MSQYYFSKLFKMSTGTTPHQYVMRQRVERAQEHLRESRTALAEVATQVGFETQSHFTSVFRRLVGATPKHYREMHQASPHQAWQMLEQAGEAVEQRRIGDCGIAAVRQRSAYKQARSLIAACLVLALLKPIADFAGFSILCLGCGVHAAAAARQLVDQRIGVVDLASATR